MTQQQQSREFDVSDLSSTRGWGKGKNLTRFRVPRKGLFDMVTEEPGT